MNGCGCSVEITEAILRPVLRTTTLRGWQIRRVGVRDKPADFSVSVRFGQRHAGGVWRKQRLLEHERKHAR